MLPLRASCRLPSNIQSTTCLTGARLSPMLWCPAAHVCSPGSGWLALLSLLCDMGCSWQVDTADVRAHLDMLFSPSCPYPLWLSHMSMCICRLFLAITLSAFEANYEKYNRGTTGGQAALKHAVSCSVTPQQSIDAPSN